MSYGLGRLRPALRSALASTWAQIVFLVRAPYDRVTAISKQARANDARCLEHLSLRSEAVYNFQLAVLPRRVLGGSCGARSPYPRYPPSWPTCGMLLDYSDM